MLDIQMIYDYKSICPYDIVAQKIIPTYIYILANLHPVISLQTSNSTRTCLFFSFFSSTYFNRTEKS